MGAIKNMMMHYANRLNISEDFRDWEQNTALKVWIHYLLDVDDYSIEPDIFDLFNALYDEDVHDDLYLMVIDKDGCVYNPHSDNLEEHIRKASILSQYSHNLYFVPNTFYGWKKKKNAVGATAIFVDIDDLEDVDFSEMTDEELGEWLTETYDIPEELLPNWCVTSGHGLHLYYLVDKLNLRNAEDSECWEAYTNYLITYFSADIACRNKDRNLRVPGSLNVKHEERKTILHKLNDSEDRSIERLEYFFCNQDEITNYYQKQKEKKNAKSKATRERNKQKRLENPDASTPKKKTTTTHKAKSSKYPTYTQSDWDRIAQMSFHTNFNPNARYKNVIKDLHNYYLRHHGQIFGHRNLFFLIMASFLRKTECHLTDALQYLDQYMDDDCRDEAIQTITRVFTQPQNFDFKNVTIAELLGFTEEDIKNSYSNFSHERQEQARKETQRRCNEKVATKRKEERGTEKRRAKAYDFVKAHPEMTSTALSEYLGLSTRTIKRIRKKIREEGTDDFLAE